MSNLYFEKISKEEFRTILKEELEESVKDLIHRGRLSRNEEYLTRQQIAKILNISLPTLDNLTKQGKLTRYAIDNVYRYKLSDIEKAFESKKSNRRE